MKPAYIQLNIAEYRPAMRARAITAVTVADDFVINVRPSTEK
jgi:hypothetical protein